MTLAAATVITRLTLCDVRDEFEFQHAGKV